MAKVNQFDAIIVGGGMIGAAVAVGLAKAGWQVALLENQLPQPAVTDAPPDLRVSAIGCRAAHFLQQLGAWQQLPTERLTAYRRLETWEQIDNLLAFDANDIDLPELGFMVENQQIQRGLWQLFAELDGLTLFCPVTLQHMQQGTDKYWQLTLADDRKLTTPLVIGADGANSTVRRMADIGCTGWQYRQSCLLIRANTTYSAKDITWQQFFPSGPRAYLPLFDHWASLAWYDVPARIHQLSHLPPQELSRQISLAFPERLGEIEVSATASFELTRRHAQSYIKPGLVLVGDAAHTIHPLAGQGVNLGYRDAEVLLDLLTHASLAERENQLDHVLHNYQRQRRPDNLLMQTGMDIFYTMFSNNIPPVTYGRNLLLKVAHHAEPVKRQVLRYALGLF